MSTHTTTLSNAQLDEMAALDAWGLLDPNELGAFEAAFANCGPTDRARLRGIQDACTEDAAASCQDPPAELRAKVLQRLQAVQDIECMNLQAHRDTQPTPMQRSPQGFASPAVWRLAALVLLAVSVTLVVMNRETTAQYNRLLDEHTLVSALGSLQSDMSPDEQASFVAMLRRPDVRHSYITANDGHGLVRIAIDEVDGEAFVLAMDLTGRPSPCVLEMETANGEIIVLAEIRTDRPIDARRLALDVSKLDGATFRLRTTDGAVIGSSLA
jgi:hypothetical protein